MCIIMNLEHKAVGIICYCSGGKGKGVVPVNTKVANRMTGH